MSELAADMYIPTHTRAGFLRNDLAFLAGGDNAPSMMLLFICPGYRAEFRYYGPAFSTQFIGGCSVWVCVCVLYTKENGYIVRVFS